MKPNTSPAEPELLSRAELWAAKRGLSLIRDGMALTTRCPKCSTGLLQIEPRTMAFFCLTTGAYSGLTCRVDGAGEKELDALFDEKKL